MTTATTIGNGVKKAPSSGLRRWSDRVRKNLWCGITRLFAREYLQDLYTGIFNRDLDQGAISAYLETASGPVDRLSVMRSLIESAEFKEKTLSSSLAILAPETVQALYRGILGRDADEAGFAFFTDKLAKRGNLEAVITGMVKSVEFQHESFAALAPEITRALYRGLLDREAGQEDLDMAIRELGQPELLEPLVADLVNSDEFQRRSFAAFAPETAEALYRGILGREADPEGLDATSRHLSRKENLEPVLADMLASGEFQQKVFARLAPDLARGLFRGILGREGEDGGIENLTRQLTKKEDLESVAAGLVACEEFQQKVFAALAPELARALFRGILGREGEAEGLGDLTQHLARKENLESIVAGLVGCEEFQQNYIALLAPELARALFRGIMGRHGDTGAIDALAKQLSRKEALESAVAGLINCEEFQRKSFALHAPEMARSLSRGILGREVDPEHLDALIHDLTESDNFDGVLASMMGSDEFRRNNLGFLPPEIVRALYLGILGREADPEGLESSTPQLAQRENLAPLVASMVNSEEFQCRNFALLAPAIARALFRGVLGREPEPEALDAYTRQLSQMENVEAVVASLANSEEFQRRTFALMAPEMVRALFRGILGRDPEPEALEAYTGHLALKENLEAVASSLAKSAEFQQRATGAFPATEMARALLRGILGREPEPDLVESFSKELTQLVNIEGVVANLVRSEEFQRKSFAFLAPELAGALHRGILKREAEPADLANFTQQLVRKKNLEDVVSDLMQSDEFQRKSFAAFAPDLARALFAGILGREPERGAIETLTQQLTHDRKLDGALYDLIGSDEFKRKAFASRTQGLVTAFYHAVLNREPDESGLKAYSSSLASTGDATPILRRLIQSAEFHRAYANADRLARADVIAHAERAPDLKCWVFIHIMKTGGTSIQNLLGASFPPTEILKEHDDTLSRRRPEKLAPYSVFAGHFNYDSLVYIPRKTLSLLTFVREPVDRLYSYYYFLRAHEPENAFYGKLHKAANTMEMESFFSDSEFRMSFDIWNQMTWAIMGARQWEAWQLLLCKSTDAVSNEDFINTVARPAIRQRLRQFAFIGFQDDFDRSVRILCDIIQVPQPEVIPADNTLVGVMETLPAYKRTLKREPITASCRKVVEGLVQLDQVLYEEAKVLYAELVARHASPVPRSNAAPCGDSGLMDGRADPASGEVISGAGEDLTPELASKGDGDFRTA